MPSISVVAESVDEAWQMALARVLKFGDDIETEYDKPEDPPSKDATVMIEVTDPFSHPMKMRNRAMSIKSNCGNEWTVYGSDADTYLIGSIQSNYIEEVLDGINDENLWKSESSFPYSYHDRIFNYVPYALEDIPHAHHDVMQQRWKNILSHQKLQKFIDVYGNEDENGEFKESTRTWEFRKGKLVEHDGKREEIPALSPTEFSDNGGVPIEFIKFPPMNQLHPIKEKLSKCPHSRRCQFTTWRPYSDPFRPDPPCLQRGLFRIIGGKLRLQTTWRSRDLFRAWEANVNGMLYIQKMMLNMINNIREKNGNEPHRLGSYTDFSNSLHIYGSNFKELLDILERMRKRNTIHPELEERIGTLRDLLNA